MVISNWIIAGNKKVIVFLPVRMLNFALDLFSNQGSLVDVDLAVNLNRQNCSPVFVWM